MNLVSVLFSDLFDKKFIFVKARCFIHFRKIRLKIGLKSNANCQLGARSTLSGRTGGVPAGGVTSSPRVPPAGTWIQPLRGYSLKH